ncbi:MAG: extracellular solute-binding protein [Geminicoccaceae bacterium]|jgi:putative spermidine/putrescine transport system substrate-binding protein|nr:extracellular solute-binding protein [Geminicoccaceae bacterium]MCB9967378.1 extracellular solute-binding protein [Geminicoccaceae bacterium]HRY24734.1 extracellular solute-binding protein [Geminicoccaceae bacterium]
MILPRRHVIGGAAALAGTATLGRLARPARAAVSEFRMTEAGGASGDSIQAGYIEPFTGKTGIKVVRESPSGLGKLRAMVEARSITSALLELSSPELEQAKALDLVEALDWAAIDPLPIFPDAKDEYGFGYQYYSTIMAWHPDAKAPSTWAEFFDVESFPGKRALPDYAAYILAMAAMADGVPPEELYPIDLDRAFGKLESIKDDVAVWWQAGAQPPQLIKDNEVQYAVAWSGRVAGQDGVRFSFAQGQLDLAFFVVPKGADPEVTAAAMGLLHEMTVPENQAVAAAVIPYTGNSPDLDPLLPQDSLNQFPTTAENRSIQVLSDARWWFENADEVELRWQEFKLSL